MEISSRNLEKDGVIEKFVDLFMKCVTSAQYQINRAGREFGNIAPERGLCQCDPLSYFLFLACTEDFRAIIKDYERRGMIKGIQVARGAPIVSHMFFVNDSYIFCRANKEEASQITKLLCVVEQVSRQKINVDKPSMFFSRNVGVVI